MRGFLLSIVILFSVTAFAQKGGKKPASGYDIIHPFKNGIAKVEIAGKYGFINEAGEEYIPVKYDFIGPFKNGLAIVSLNGRRGLINEAGEEVVTLQ